MLGYMFEKPFGLHGYRKGGDPGAINRIIEQQRQGRIKANIGRINTIFDGPPVVRRGINQTTDVSGGGDFFDAQGNPIDPAIATADFNTQLEKFNADLIARQNRTPFLTSGGDRGFQSRGNVRGGNNQVLQNLLLGPEPTQPNQPRFFTDVAETGGGGFNDEFFNNIADSFVNFQDPLFKDQAEEARRGLPARFATTFGSPFQREAAKLEKEILFQKTKIRDDAQQFANQKRVDVEQNRTSLINLASTVDDASAISASANARANQLSRPESFSPVADLFKKFANTTGTVLEANAIARNPGSLLFPSQGSSVRLVG